MSRFSKAMRGGHYRPSWRKAKKKKPYISARLWKLTQREEYDNKWYRKLWRFIREKLRKG